MGSPNPRKAERLKDGDDAEALIGDGKPADAAHFGWRQLLALDDRLQEERKIRLLTPEARVLIHLKIGGPMSITTAMQIAGTSHRGFYAVLERLRQAGVIGTTKDEQDQRVRRLELDASDPISPPSS
jgi:hypothetical protein